MIAGSRGTPFVSRARLSGLRCTLRCAREVLAPLLPPGAALWRASEPPGGADEHPLCLEVWRVDDGHLELGGLDQLEWLELAASGAAALLRRVLPGSRSQASSSWLGAPRRGAQRALRACRRSLLLDGYNELALYVPDVTLERHGAPRSLVLAMCTDSPSALWIDRAFGYGYGKRLAHFEHGRGGALGVYDERGRPLVSLAARTGDVLDARELAQAEAGLGQPWLGRLGPGVVAESRLSRSLSAGRVMRVVGALTLSGALTRVTGHHELRPFSAADRWPSLAFADLPVRISLPQRSARLR